MEYSIFLIVKYKFSLLEGWLIF